MSKSVVQNDLFGPIGPDRDLGELSISSEVPLVTVAFDSASDDVYDYAVPAELRELLSIGQRIKAPFGRANRSTIGFCVAFPSSSDFERVKTITELIDERPLIGPDGITLAYWISQYYCCPLGVVLSAMVPAAVKRRVGMVKRTYLGLTELGRRYLCSPGDLTVGRVSEKGRAILSAIERGGDSAVLLEDIAVDVGCGKGPFKSLARLGLISITVKRELAKSAVPDLPAQLAPAAEICLNDEQRIATERICGMLDNPSFNVVLLNGVTGSGKTEVYIRCIARALAQGKQALVLVPEIALTPQTLGRFLGRFGRVAVLHSGLSNPERHRQWSSISAGVAGVVVGARSAVFAPLAELGLIVVDEEHEPSYKQETSPRYHGRDVAIKLAQIKGIPILLGSATPSLETLYNAETRPHYHHLRLTRRVLDLPLPPVSIVDMRIESIERRGGHLLSRMLEGELRRCLAERRQAILLLNRRGHSQYIFCPSCQFAVTCPNCDVSLTYHKGKSQAGESSLTLERSWVMCHYCLHSCRVPAACPVCSKKLMLIGPGTQRLEEELARKFPNASIQRADSDSMRSLSYSHLMDRFAAGEIDILFGTQIIGKGLDFPNVSLVGVLNADTALSLPDFRSSERTFQLISQVAGRCGRGSADGRVVVQSYNPTEPAITLACNHDASGFARQEQLIRQRCAMPPYSRLGRIILRDPKLDKLETTALQLREHIDHLSEQLGISDVLEVRGPVPALISRIENYHRQELRFRSTGPGPIQKLLYELRKGYLGGLNVRIAIDVDPINLL